MFALLLLFLTSSIAIVGKRPIETPPDTSTFDVSQSIPANKVPQEQALHQHKRSNARQIVVEEKVRKHVPNLHRKISQPIGLQATPGAIPENVSPRPRQISRTYVDEVPTGVEEQYDVSQSAPGEYAPTEQAFVQEEVSGGDLSEAEYEQALKQIPGEETKAEEGIYDVSQSIPGEKIAREGALHVPASGIKPTMSFGGYVKTDVFWDTRQVTSIRDGHVLFYPMAYLPDVLGRDINKAGDFNFLAIQTRLWTKMTGPRIGGHKHAVDPSGYVEIDFFGTNDAVINTPRIRYAMLELHAKHFWFMAGQYNHPMLVDEVNAGDTISFDAGVPYELFSRNPQIRLEYHSPKFRMYVAAISEVDFRSFGPATDQMQLTNSQDTRFLRNSKIPILDLHIQGKVGNHVIGGGIDVRTLKPRLSSTTNYKVFEHITSVCAVVYAKLRFKDFEVKGKFHFTENPAAYLMIGGYAISNVCPITNQTSYTNLRGVTAWFEMSLNRKIAPGIFVGFFKNVGSAKPLAPLSTVPGATSFNQLCYGRGTNIGFSWRVSPRINWFWKSLQVGGELEITNAHYGNVLQNGNVQTTNVVTNYRPIVGIFYYF